VFGGILLRSLLTSDDELINGSSLCVEHLLLRTGHGDVASLAGAVSERNVAAQDSVLHLRMVPERAQAIYYTSRVGLTLKRVAEHPEMLDFIVRPYRALTQPRRIEKGRVQLILALHHAGERPDAIAALTGAPKRTVARYIADYERGQALESTELLHGRSLNASELCLLHGALQR
jgi:hypothetical protein